MRIDLTSLTNAIGNIEVALQYHERAKTGPDPVLVQLHRAAAIQAFEYTYELCPKLLRRYFAENSDSTQATEELNFDGLMRRGYEFGLLDADVVIWRGFRAARGTTSHAYDSDKAEDVFQDIPEFLVQAKFLLKQLEARQQPL